MTGNPAQPEFSRLLLLDDLGDEPLTREMTATESERAGLAARFGVVELRSIGAELTVSAVGSRGVRVEGRAHAELVQDCVVTLEPIEERIAEIVAVSYLPEGDDAFEQDEIVAVDDEDVETLEGDSIDLGELVAQTVAAAVDPYPRKDGAEFGKASRLGDNEGGVRENPFAVLKGLKPANGNAEKE